MNISPRSKPDDAKLLDVLRESSIAKQALQEQAKASLQHRKQLVKELDELEEKALRELPELRAAVQDAIEEANAARRSTWTGASIAEANAAITIAQAKAGAAQHKSAMASLAYQSVHDAIEHELRSTAAPEIALFIREMQDAADVTRKTTIVRSAVRINPVTGQKTVTSESSYPAVKARLAAIREAIDEANGMQLDPDQSNMSVRFEALRQALPSAS